MQHLPLAALYSSDLRRAVDTATAIAQNHGLEVKTDPRFREINEGDWEGLTEDKIRAGWPDLWETRHWSRRPGGESPDVRLRSLAALEELVHAYSQSSIAVVTSQGTIRMIIAEALGYDDRRSASIRGLTPGEVVRLEARLSNGKLVLSNVNFLDGSPANFDPSRPT